MHSANSTMLLLLNFCWPMFVSDIFVLISSSFRWAVSPTFGLNTHQDTELQFRSYDVAMQSWHIGNTLSRTRTAWKETQSCMTGQSSIDINPQNVKLFNTSYCRQFSTVITPPNITWFHTALLWLTQNVNQSVKHKLHPISRPNGRSIECVLRGFDIKLTAL